MPREDHAVAGAGTTTSHPDRGIASPTTALAALRERRFLRTRWPWQSLAYLITTPLAGLLTLPMVLLAAPWLMLLLRLAGGEFRPVASLALLTAAGTVLVGTLGPVAAIPVTAVERLRLRLVDRRPLASVPRRSAAGDLRSWLRERYTNPDSWREVGGVLLLVLLVPLLYGGLLLVVALIGTLVAAPFLAAGDAAPVALGPVQVGSAGEALPYAAAGAALLPTLPYLLAAVAGGHAAVTRVLLEGQPSERLRAELVEVTRSRARLADAFEAERRRIERDLHDGAQQRLVGLTLQLGLARLDLPAGSPAEAAVARAHEQAKQLMTELRELIHGIHPQILVDRGLPAALRELADRCPVPVTVRVEVPVRPDRHLEATAYFVVAEALTNVVSHSGATAARVVADAREGLLTVEITDNGRGGADPSRGSGLTGLSDRAAIAAGRMFLSSPAGGPTVLRVELPCHQHPAPAE